MLIQNVINELKGLKSRYERTKFASDVSFDRSVYLQEVNDLIEELDDE